MDNNLAIREGQTIKVTQKITEGKRERNVPFQGRVMKVRGIGVNKTVTVRQTLEGIEVDRIFPLASPTLTVQVVELKQVKKFSKKGKKPKKNGKK